ETGRAVAGAAGGGIHRVVGGHGRTRQTDDAQSGGRGGGEESAAATKRGRVHRGFSFSGRCDGGTAKSAGGPHHRGMRRPFGFAGVSGRRTKPCGDTPAPAAVSRRRRGRRGRRRVRAASGTCSRRSG